jgi:hydrogenase expression/formation protein HypE
MTTHAFLDGCPVPQTTAGQYVLLAHGEGGRLTRQLIRQELLPAFANEVLAAMGDAATLPPVGQGLALTTDSFVVSPLFFPGGDIGTLAVYGTVNDLAVAGAEPLWLSVALVLEEGLPLELLRRVVQRIALAARRSGVTVVAGDTKVVPRGAADQIFITTAGVGRLVQPAPLGPTAIATGDALLISGPIGRHGVAVLAAREALALEPPPESDCAPLTPLAAALRTAGVPVRAMRDATRGGVTAVLHEWAHACGLTLAIDEAAVPVSAEVRGACELLGLDPLHVANEGTMVVAVPGE